MIEAVVRTPMLEWAGVLFFVILLSGLNGMWDIGGKLSHILRRIWEVAGPKGAKPGDEP